MIVDGGTGGRPDAGDHRGAYQNAARKATDDHLLPGEDVTVTSTEDATHWLRVYGELLDFKEGLLSMTRSTLTRVTDPARDEIESTDLLVLEAERNRFVRRLRFWQTRLRELASGD